MKRDAYSKDSTYGRAIGELGHTRVARTIGRLVARCRLLERHAAIYERLLGEARAKLPGPDEPDPMALLLTEVGYSPLGSPETFTVIMRGAFAAEGWPADGPVLLAQDDEDLDKALAGLEIGCDLVHLPVAVRGLLDNHYGPAKDKE